MHAPSVTPDVCHRPVDGAAIVMGAAIHANGLCPIAQTTALITRNIGQAEKTIRIAAYSFTSQPIADA
jgi:hypothetical protein